MKRLFEFNVSKKETVDVEEISTNEQGEQVKTTKKQEKEIPQKFFLRKPNRALNDAANLFYGVKIAEGTRAGMLTIAQLDRRNSEDGGLLTNQEDARSKTLWAESLELEKKYVILDSVKTEERTEEQKKEHQELGEKLSSARMELQRIETFKNVAYENTAEVRARNWVTTWWLVNLSYQEVDGKAAPFFGEGTVDERLSKYDELIEKENDFINKVILKFLTYVSLWVNNRAVTPEDFAKFEKILEESEK